MQPKIYLLIANGDLNCSVLKYIDIADFQQVIALDGGVLKALNCGIEPHIIIGDLDSIPPDLKDDFANKQFIHQPSQEMNDLEKGLRYCIDAGAEKIIILGLTGGRTDHLFTNFSVLVRYHQQVQLEILDEFAKILLIRDRFHYKGTAGQLISLIPIGKVSGIVTEGLKYPLNNETLEFGIREGLSNVVISNPVKISLQTGLLLLFLHWTENR